MPTPGTSLAYTLDGAIQRILQALDLVEDAFLGIAIAVVIHERTVLAVVLQIINGLDALMALGALIDAHLKGMLIMATEAGIEARHMAELGIIGLAVVLIPHLSLRAVQRGAGGEVVDIDETEVGGLAGGIRHRFYNGIHIRHLEVGDLLVDADLGFTALMALHAARLRAQVLDLLAGGESDRSQSHGRRIVAGGATERAGGCGHIRADLAIRGKILEASRGVAPGAVSRNDRGACRCSSG